jgi:hypothetical protein
MFRSGPRGEGARDEQVQAPKLLGASLFTQLRSSVSKIMPLPASPEPTITGDPEAAAAIDPAGGFGTSSYSDAFGWLDCERPARSWHLHQCCGSGVAGVGQDLLEGRPMAVIATGGTRCQELLKIKASGPHPPHSDGSPGSLPMACRSSG